MARQLLNSTWYVAAKKNKASADSPVQGQKQDRLMPWLVDSPTLFYESYEECAGNLKPDTEQVVEVTVSIVGTRKKLTVD